MRDDLERTGDSRRMVSLADAMRSALGPLFAKLQTPDPDPDLTRPPAAADQSRAQAQNRPSPVASPSPESERDYILVDSELGRVTVALKLASQFRFWLIGHELSRQRGGRGWCSVDELWAAIQAIPHYDITRRHFRRILQRGEGIFWQRWDDDRLGLTAITKLSANLVTEAYLLGLPAVVDTNLPGGRKSVWIPLSGTHEQLEASIYNGWLAAKDSPTIARDTLSALWNRSPQTIRRWEHDRLADRLNVVQNRAILQHPEINPAEDAFYDRSVKSRVYQLPNTYQAAARQTPHSGQRRKIQRAVAGSYLGAGADTRRLYFETVKGLKSAIKRHPGGTTRFAFMYHRRGVNYWNRSSDIYLPHLGA